MRFAIAAAAVLPIALSGCGLAFDLFMDQVQRAYGVPVQPAPNLLADRATTIAGSVVVTMWPQSVFAPTDNRYLLEGLAARLRRHFPDVVVMDAGSAAFTVLQLDTTRDSSNAQPAVVHVVVRVYDNGRSLQSIISGPAVAADLKAADRSGPLDELLTGLEARLDTLLFQK